MHEFEASIDIIGINPFVFVPEIILKDIFKQAGKDKGKIPVHGSINDVPYQQTLVRYSGDWRLYINTTMLKNSPKRIGETIKLTIEFDPADRTIPPHPELVKALNENPSAKAVFDKLAPSIQNEIIRYIANLKTAASIDRNIIRAVQFLSGNGSFVGRDKL